jgi:hypothetical protein
MTTSLSKAISKSRTSPTPTVSSAGASTTNESPPALMSLVLPLPVWPAMLLSLWVNTVYSIGHSTSSRM